MALERGLASSAPGLTASFRVSTYRFTGAPASSLLGAADQALQAAKRLGGNRSVISSAEVAGILARPPRVAMPQVGWRRCCRSPRRWTGATPGAPRTASAWAASPSSPRGSSASSPDAVERVRLAGILHDVGAVARFPTS